MKKTTVALDGSTLTVNNLVGLARAPGLLLEVGQEARVRVKACRDDLVVKLNDGARIYGRLEGQSSLALFSKYACTRPKSSPMATRG